jgi:hypothetical protein
VKSKTDTFQYSGDWEEIARKLDSKDYAYACDWTTKGDIENGGVQVASAVASAVFRLPGKEFVPEGASENDEPVMLVDSFAQELVCVDNFGLEDKFDAGAKYKCRLHALPSLLLVTDKLGVEAEYLASRFVAGVSAEKTDAPNTERLIPSFELSGKGIAEALKEADKSGLRARMQEHLLEPYLQGRNSATG